MRAVARLLLIGAAFAALAFLKEPDTTLFWEALYDLGHVFLFAVVMKLVRDLPWVRSNGSGFAVTVLLAVISELLQLEQAGRDASFMDVLRDADGAVVFLLLDASRASKRRPLRYLFAWSPMRLRIAAGALLLLVAVPFITLCAAYVARNLAFPILCRFDGSYWEQRLISTVDATLVPTAAEVDPREPIDPPSYGKLLLRPGRYPRLEFDEPYPDWTGFTHLDFTVISPERVPMTLTVRIQDRAYDRKLDDRFYRRITIHPGENRVSISLEDVRLAPIGRPVDLKHIRGLVLYARDLQRPAHVYISPMRLQ